MKRFLSSLPIPLCLLYGTVAFLDLLPFYGDGRQAWLPWFGVIPGLLFKWLAGFAVGSLPLIYGGSVYARDRVKTVITLARLKSERIDELEAEIQRLKGKPVATVATPAPKKKAVKKT